MYGSSEESVLVAVVIPEKPALESWAKENNASGSFEELCRNPQVTHSMFCSQTLATGKEMHENTHMSLPVCETSFCRDIFKMQTRFILG